MNAALRSLEKLLHELEALRYKSDVDRDRYNLIASVLTRLRNILSDLQCFERNEFEPRQPATETIGIQFLRLNERIPRFVKIVRKIAKIHVYFLSHIEKFTQILQLWSYLHNFILV